MLRIILWGLAAIFTGLVLLVVAAVLLFNPNHYRGRISTEVDQRYHRKLDIGDIRLSIFPTLGVRIKNLKLDNAPGFGPEPMAEVGEAEVGIRILPLLLHNSAEISSITLKEMHLQLLRHADGKSNWEDLNEHKAQPAPSGPQPHPEPHPGPGAQPQGGGIGSLQIGGIDIEDANISYVDQQAHKSYAVAKFSLSTGTIKEDKPFDFKLAFSAALAEPALNADVQVKARLGYSAATEAVVMQDLEAGVDASGAAVPGGKQSLKLEGSAYIDGGKGDFKLDNGKLSLANLVVALKLEGSGLDGEGGRISGQLNVAPFDPRATFKALGLAVPDTADANALKQASLSANVEMARNQPGLENIVLKLDQSTLTGSVGMQGSAAAFALKLDQIDADRYLAVPAKRNPVAPSAPGKPGEGEEAPLPLDKLDGSSASGTLDIGQLKIKNLKLAQVRLKLAAAKGAQKSLDLGAALYGGTLAATTHIGPGAKPALGQTLKLDAINAGPLLLDFMGKDYVSGNGNMALDVTSSGNTMNQIKHGLNGTLSIALKDGAVKGFNLAQLIRQAQSLGGGQAPEQGSGQQTDFSTLSASGKISNGVLHSDDLNGASPLLRLTGAGQVDIGNSTLDYLAKPTLVNTASGQGGKQLVNLQGIVIPVRVYGPFAGPKYQLDVAEALKQETVQKLTQKLGNGKAGDLVNQLQGLFGKKKQ